MEKGKEEEEEEEKEEGEELKKEWPIRHLHRLSPNSVQTSPLTCRQRHRSFEEEEKEEEEAAEEEEEEQAFLCRRCQ